MGSATFGSEKSLKLPGSSHLLRISGALRWPVILGALTVAAVVLLLVTRPRPAVTAVEERVWHIQTQSVRLGSHTPTLLLYGKAQSPAYLQITSALEADVQEMKVREGAAVNSGDTLMVLDAREALERLAQRRAELGEIDALTDAERTRHKNDLAAIGQEKLLAQLADKAVERARSLEKKALLSSTQMDEALQLKARQDLALITRQHAIDEHPARMAQLQTRREQTAARLKLAELELERTRITAPFAGKITRTPVAAGKRVRAGETLIELFPFGSVEVRAQIPSIKMATLTHALAERQPVTAAGRVDSTHLSLELSRLSSFVEDGRGGVDGLFHVISGEEALQIGRVVELLVTLQAVDNTFLVPHEAVYGSDRLYKIVDGRLRAINATVVGEIRTLDAPGTLIIQSEQVTTGDRVLVTKFANAIDGLRVDAQSAETAP